MKRKPQNRLHSITADSPSRRAAMEADMKKRKNQHEYVFVDEKLAQKLEKNAYEQQQNALDLHKTPEISVKTPFSP